MYTIIELEDNGQDFLKIITDHVGVIIELQPFNTGAFLGGLIPIGQEDMMEIGKELPIHHPPNISFGFLKHKIKNVQKVPNFTNDANL